MAGVGLATAGFWLARPFLDKGQASLLYLPVVIACAIRYGFGPAVAGACLSFLCWDFFFLPPFGTFAVHDPKDWLSLFVFLVAALSTAQLAALARVQTQQAQAREAEIVTLFQASETLSREVRSDRVLTALTDQIRTLCRVTRCLVFRRAPSETALRPASGGDSAPPAVEEMARAAAEQDQVIGFGVRRHLWAKGFQESRLSGVTADTETLGVYLPLHAEGQIVGVLHVGPRRDGQPFSSRDERLIRTLANHTAVVLARDALAEQAAQVQALREADVLKDSLLSLVSHELRTPLAAIKASATGLLQPQSVWDEEMRSDSLRAINRETDRLSGLVTNLLDLSRLEAGAWQPHKDWCDLAEIIGTALDRLPDDGAARVRVEIADGLPLVRADYTQIALVLTNLLENALKYTPEGSPIHLSACRLSDAVRVTVRDFGAGLTPGEEEHLWERFYRGSAHRDSLIHGTGLGLALCQAIVKAHGGRLQAANAPAREPSGAVFSVTLPVNLSP